MTTSKLWEPSPLRVRDAFVSHFMRKVEAAHGASLPDFHALWRWSVDYPVPFWRTVWQECGVIGSPGERTLVEGERMQDARWFPDAKLNFAQNLLGRRPPGDAGDALVFWGEDKVKRRYSHAQMVESASKVASALAAQGLRVGDRVAAYMPNLPETIIAMLGTAAKGCVWSSCSPDFGVQGVLDRFGQIEPRVLFTVDGYWYHGKPISILDKVAEIVENLPTVERVIVVPYLEEGIGGANEFPPLRGGCTWEAFIAPFAGGPIDYEVLPYNHPLYILYSSGTTGVPKCIVHGAGGTLLQHLKEHKLHGDVKPGDRVFYFTTCGWMMWNWLASALAAEATLLLFDGSPFVMRGRVLWEFASAERMTHFGTSAKYIDSLRKVALVPVKDYALDALRAMFSTGSPLSPESFDFVYEAVKHDICLSSISGGTDIVSCFALGAPTLPVYRGEIQSRGLGMAVAVFDEDGNPLPEGRGARGELVCTAPFPSMPIGFWNDPDGSKYAAAYFDRFPGVWCHGDYVEITAHGGVIIYGRSDATLNPGGVRIGTAEIYRQVEQLPEVLESLVIGQDWPPGEVGDVRVVLFVKLREGLTLDGALIERIQRKVRANTTPRHVPAKIVQVNDIPRTKSGKIVELAVRNVVHGIEVRNREALANPEALDAFRDREELKD